jgi:hypothetical protein
MVALLAIAGLFFIKGFAMTIILVALVGASICFNLINRVIYSLYHAASEKISTAKKATDAASLFKGRLGKIACILTIAAYLGMSVWKCTMNAKLITSMSVIGMSYAAAVAIDLLIIDTILAMICSQFFKRTPLAQMMSRISDVSTP